MIQLDFSSDFLERDIKKLSVIADADSFVYGLFDNRGTMVSRGHTDSAGLNEFAHTWAEWDCEIHFMSTSKAFSFSDETNVPSNQNNNIRIDKWADTGIYCAYEEAAIIENNWHYKHISTAWLQFASSKSDANLWLHFRDKSVLIACSYQQKFLFFNEFHIETAEDVIYYVMAVIKEACNLTLEEVNVMLSGQITVNSSFYQLLYRYIPRLETAASAHFLTASEVLGDHVYFDHFLNVNCYAHH